MQQGKAIGHVSIIYTVCVSVYVIKCNGCFVFCRSKVSTKLPLLLSLCIYMQENYSITLFTLASQNGLERSGMVMIGGVNTSVPICTVPERNGWPCHFRIFQNVPELFRVVNVNDFVPRTILLHSFTPTTDLFFALFAVRDHACLRLPRMAMRSTYSDHVCEA